MFEGANWDKLPERIFENFEIAWVKREQFQNFQKSQKIARTKRDYWLIKTMVQGNLAPYRGKY